MFADILWEIFQLGRIERSNWSAADAKLAANEARLDVRPQSMLVQQLEWQFERLSLVTTALAEILQERLGATDTVIENKIIEIDLRDGKRDGRLRFAAGSVAMCPKCDRPCGTNRSQCVYCGEQLSPWPRS